MRATVPTVSDFISKYQAENSDTTFTAVLLPCVFQNQLASHHQRRMSNTKAAMFYLVNHVFLTPCLPEGDNWKAAHDLTLQSTFLASIEKFEAHVASGRRALARSAAAMIRRMI